MERTSIRRWERGPDQRKRRLQPPQSDGTLLSFYSDGRLGVIQDRNGNSITAGYRDGVMAYLRASNGDQLDFTYNRGPYHEGDAT